jgi:uncharacterized protein
MHSIISQKAAALGEVCRRYGVDTLEVFGSAARGIDFSPDSSDADFLVVFKRPPLKGPLEEYFGLKEELSALLGREVDLIELGAVHNPYVLGNINSSRELVYAA